MTQTTEELITSPADLVPVAVAAFEETWRSRKHSLTLMRVIASFTREEAKTRLWDAPERDATAALELAWGVVSPILERHMRMHNYLGSTIKSLLAEAESHVTHVAENDGGP